MTSPTVDSYPAQSQTAEFDSPNEALLAQAEQWLSSQASHTITYPEIVESATANNEPVPTGYEQIEPVPADIAGKVALIAQQRLGMWDKHDLFPDELGGGLEQIRNEALQTADELDFGVISSSLPQNWPLRARLNSLHEKFKHVSSEDIRNYLGYDDITYEDRALSIRDIIADHSPELLTSDLRILMDPSEPAWRVAGTHASILLRSRRQQNLDTYNVASMPGVTSEEPTRSIASLSDEELTHYVSADALPGIRERGTILFSELSLPTRQAVLARRFYEMGTKSSDPTAKAEASERNKALEHQPVLQPGDLVHATFTPEILEKVLDHGLQCGEAVLGNTRGQVNYPFTVSFLEVGQEDANHESVTDRLDLLRNQGYGFINIVLHRDADSTDYGREQNIASRQRQIFGGVPSTEIKSIIIRDHDVSSETADGVIKTIVKHGMFIPVYDGNGELLLSSEQFDAQQKLLAGLGNVAVEK